MFTLRCSERKHSVLLIKLLPWPKDPLFTMADAKCSLWPDAKENGKYNMDHSRSKTPNSDVSKSLEIIVDLRAGTLSGCGCCAAAHHATLLTLEVERP